MSEYYCCTDGEDRARQSSMLRARDSVLAAREAVTDKMSWSGSSMGMGEEERKALKMGWM